MATRTRNTKPTSAKPKADAPITDADFRALLTAKQAVTSAVDDTSAIDAAKWARFDSTCNAMASFATILRDRFAPKVGGRLVGNALHNAIVKDDTSAIYCHDAAVRSGLGSNAHFTRCIDMLTMDTPERREQYRAQGNRPNYQTYLDWYAVLSGKADTAKVDAWDVGRDAKGKAISAKPKPKARPATPDTPKDGAPKVTAPDAIADLLVASPDALDAVITAGVDGIAIDRIPDAKVAACVRVLLARLLVTAAPAVDPDAVDLGI